MKLTKWQKITALIMLIGGVVYIGYDIFILNKEEDATISNIMFILLNFPLIIYSWFVLGGHFISPFERFKKRSIKLLIILSSVILILSILSICGIISFNSLALCVISLIGFFVGAICWNQRVKDVFF